MTPTLYATKSPILRDMARPGTSSLANHTRLGPMSSPVTLSLKASIRPPRSIILAPSTGSQGLWSLESWRTLPPLPTTTHLESPAFAQYNFGPLSKRVQQVVPENDGSVTTRGNSSLQRWNAFFKA